MSRVAPPERVAIDVSRALAEDLGTGDATADLIDAERVVAAEVSVGEDAVLCGRAWFDEAFRQLDASIATTWQHEDGDAVAAGATICRVTGPARGILSAERTALNFLQLLSGTATAARRFSRAVAGTEARILDTRKTIPGLRAAQKYAVRCGGGHNHRAGLFDAILVKENHIAAFGTIDAAVEHARTKTPGLLFEVEVETLHELELALDSHVDRIMLDDFSLEAIRQAVSLRDTHALPRKELEASGGVTLENVRSIAETGVDWISVGAITKHVIAIDFSMRFV
jgi:nicotinate-nucleotide pyrophosphorylase (carboxylating)